MTQAICDITTDEVNVDVVVEPQADTMAEVANRAGGMEQVFHDNTLIGNGNSIDLGVNTDIIATKEYSDEQDTLLRNEINEKLTAIDSQIDANSDAILKTREDYQAADQSIRADMNAKDSELETILNDHAERLNTLRTDHDDLGDDVSDIQAKIPQSASGNNPLITKQQLLDEEMDIREDLNEGLSELQTQITAQATAIAGKQDELIAGDNIIISGNIISATGAGGGVGFDVIVVQELPESGEKGIIYLVPKDSAAPDVYDEYVWVTTTSTFELIGTTKVDLSGYLPLSGGTMTGDLGIEYSKRIVFDKGLGIGESGDVFFEHQGTGYGLGIGYVARYDDGVAYAYDTNFYFKVSRGLSTAFYSNKGSATLGLSGKKWSTIYVTMMNNGANIAIPTEGGTLARLEDLNTVLPDQTDNAGKFLTTDGSEASWSNKPLVNNNTIGLGIIGNTNEKYSVAIGKYASATQSGCVVISNNYGSASATNINAVCVGGDTKASGAYSTALGTYARAQADYAIQLGKGTNSDINTFKVGNNNGNFEMMSADGTIPAERIGNLDFGTMD